MNYAVIFAGGIGKRMNTKALPKQFLKLYGKEIIIYTLEHFEKHKEIDGIAVACVEEWIPYLKELIEKYRLEKVRAVIPGGRTGQDSIFEGIKAVDQLAQGDGHIVLIHDGVRPLINEQIITNCIKSVRENGSAITVSPAVETIIRVDGNQQVREVIERADCLMARAPQCFFLKDILEAHKKAVQENRHDFIDSASIMKYYGHTLSVVDGPVENIKITTPMDFYTFRALFEARESSQLFGI